MTDSALTIISDDPSTSICSGFEGPEKLLELWFAPSDLHVAQRELEIKGGRPKAKGKGKEWLGLRQVERSVWDSMLDEVQCKILSVIEGDEVDAYLLSESSMFVWPHKLILKTCGTTTLLLGLPTLLKIASETCGLQGVWRCFYSRKTFMFPDRQRGPHKDWIQEMAFLDRIFENSSAYTVGKMNGDHWLLYLTPPQADVLQPNALASSSALPPHDPSTELSTLTASLSSSNLALSQSPRTLARAMPSLPPLRQLSTPKIRLPSRPDQTLEILMSKLSPAVCHSFYHPSSSPTTPYISPICETDLMSPSSHALGSQLSTSLGIDHLFPKGTEIDSFLFSPCGFSSNAINGERYATIHVTPEVEYSYASFETNLEFGPENEGPLKANEVGPVSLQDLVEKVLAIFQPEKLSITLFVSTDEEDLTSDDEEGGFEGRVGGESVLVKRRQQEEGMKELLNKDLLARYDRVDRILYEFEGYSLVYGVFSLKKAKCLEGL